MDVPSNNKEWKKLKFNMDVKPIPDLFGNPHSENRCDMVLGLEKKEQVKGKPSTLYKGSL